MDDGGICNSLTEMSAQKCYLCVSTPKTINNIQLRLKVSNVNQYAFSLSPLHAYI